LETFYELARRPWQRHRPPRPVYPTGINRVLPAQGFSLSELDDAGVDLDLAEALACRWTLGASALMVQCDRVAGFRAVFAPTAVIRFPSFIFLNSFFLKASEQLRSGRFNFGADSGQIDGFLITFLQRDFLAFCLERLEELRIFPRA